LLLLLLCEVVVGGGGVKQRAMGYSPWHRKIHNDDERQLAVIIHRLVATSPTAMWHLASILERSMMGGGEPLTSAHHRRPVPFVGACHRVMWHCDVHRRCCVQWWLGGLNGGRWGTHRGIIKYTLTTNDDCQSSFVVWLPRRPQ